MAEARREAAGVYDEVADRQTSSDSCCADWRSERRLCSSLTHIATIQKVIATGYAPNLNDVELLTLAQDPFLVAAARIASSRPEKCQGCRSLDFFNFLLCR